MRLIKIMLIVIPRSLIFLLTLDTFFPAVVFVLCTVYSVLHFLVLVLLSRRPDGFPSRPCSPRPPSRSDVAL